MLTQSRCPTCGGPVVIRESRGEGDTGSMWSHTSELGDALADALDNEAQYLPRPARAEGSGQMIEVHEAVLWLCAGAFFSFGVVVGVLIGLRLAQSIAVMLTKRALEEAGR